MQNTNKFNCKNDEFNFIKQAKFTCTGNSSTANMTKSFLKVTNPIAKTYNCFVTNHTLHFRHTNDMIKKLEEAGLGYYVKEESTHHRFGKALLL